MKIITTIEATTDAEQEEVARLVAMLTGVSVTTTKAKVAHPVTDLVPSSTVEQVRHQVRATVHRLVQDGYREQVRATLRQFNDAEKISQVNDVDLPECLEMLHAIGEEEV